MLVPVRNAPLVSFAALGTFSLRHVGLATGEIKLPEGSAETAPALDLIEGAFRNCNVEELQATAAHVQQTIANLKAIENFVTQQVGLNNALRVPELIDTLVQMERVLAPRLAARGASTAVDGSNGVETNGAGAGGSGEARVAIGQVGSRDDVLRLLDKIVEYYERHEPSSPIPVLLRRCKRLVPMQFVDIVRELVPDGLTQFETLRGPSDEA
jgi:type VI secretion system protein ImpA